MLQTPVNSNMLAPFGNGCKVKCQYTLQDNNASSLLEFMHKNKNADKATNILILRYYHSNFYELCQYFRQFLLHFYTKKIRFYLDKQITFLNELSEIIMIISYDYRSG